MQCYSEVASVYKVTKKSIRSREEREKFLSIKTEKTPAATV